jgi:hypothetical protein
MVWKDVLLVHNQQMVMEHLETPATSTISESVHSVTGQEIAFYFYTGSTEHEPQPFDHQAMCLLSNEVTTVSNSYHGDKAENVSQNKTRPSIQLWR